MKRLRNLALALASVSALVLTGCTSINPGNVGIEISKAGSSRGVQDVALRTGWVFYNPMWTEVIEYPVHIQTVKWTAAEGEGNLNVDESLTFTTKDSMVVNADVSMSYQLNYDDVPKFYVTFRDDDIKQFTDGFMRNVARDAFNEVTGQYSVEQVMGDNGPILLAVRAKMMTQLKQYGIRIDQLGFIGAPRPPKVVTDAINMKVQAQQIALQKDNEIAQSQAEAKKNEAIAQGDAQSNIIRAQADAQANKLRAESLTPALIQWTAIQKWDGRRPQVEGAGSGLLISVK